jgi:hypothetical protein
MEEKKDFKLELLWIDLCEFCRDVEFNGVTISSLLTPSVKLIDSPSKRML